MVFDVTKTVPRFILADKTGYALAKAMEAGLNSMISKTEDGIGCILDADKMPEWRLDEMARETDCLYDFKATVEQKRNWIRDNISLFKIYGTPKAIEFFLGGYFDSVELEEAADYGGSAFNFRVTVEGVMNPANEAWARKAIEKAKNVRSVLQELRIGNSTVLEISAEEVIGRVVYPVTSQYTQLGNIL